MILLVRVFSLLRRTFSVQKHPNQTFRYTFYSQPFNEMFIFSDKCHCCNGTFAIYITANKEYLTKKTYDFRYLDSALPQLYCLKFSFILVDLSQCYARRLNTYNTIYHHHHIRFWYLWCCGSPGLRGRQHLATPHTRSPWILGMVSYFLFHSKYGQCLAVST